MQIKIWKRTKNSKKSKFYSLINCCCSVLHGWWWWWWWEGSIHTCLVISVVFIEYIYKICSEFQNSNLISFYFHMFCSNSAAAAVVVVVSLLNEVFQMHTTIQCDRNECVKLHGKLAYCLRISISIPISMYQWYSILKFSDRSKNNSHLVVICWCWAGSHQPQKNKNQTK